jgi:hypothetical protein
MYEKIPYLITLNMVTQIRKPDCADMSPLRLRRFAIRAHTAIETNLI